MIKLLEKFDYKPPLILEGNFGDVEIIKNDLNYYYLLVNGVQWMAYNMNTHLEVYEVYSHYELAEGHVVVTGLGFGARENWLLTKKEVTKLTILERSKDLIDYHESMNSSFLKDPRVEIIKCDASDYSGTCDVLLLDHYELNSYEEILTDVKKIHDAVSCKKVWFWPFERIIMHSRRWHSFEFDKTITKHEAFNLLKKNWGLYKIPDFSEQEINLFCMMFHSKLFSNSEYLLDTLFYDRNVHHEIYRCI